MATPSGADKSSSDPSTRFQGCRPGMLVGAPTMSTGVDAPPFGLRQDA